MKSANQFNISYCDLSKKINDEEEVRRKFNQTNDDDDEAKN